MQSFSRKRGVVAVYYITALETSVQGQPPCMASSDGSTGKKYESLCKTPKKAVNKWDCNTDMGQHFHGPRVKWKEPTDL